MELRPASAFTLALLMLSIVVAAPLLIADNLPFVDYPNHLARQYILETLQQSKDLQQYYTLKDGFYPYWAMRLAVGLAVPAVGIDLAGKVFAAAATLMPIAGALAICLAIHGRLTLPVLAAFAFAYNEPMAWGFQNYTLSAGVAMLMFAAWIKAASWPVWLRLGVFTIATSGLATLHLLAAGVFAGLALAWELAGGVESRPDGWARAVGKAGEIGVTLVPVAAILMLLRGEDIGITNTIFGDLQLRLTGLVSVLWTGWSKAELLLGVWLVCILGAALWLRILEMPQRCKIFMLLLLAASVAAPFAVIGVTFINMRLPLIVILVFVACSDVRAGREKAAITLACVFALLGALKLVLAINGLADRSQQITEFRNALGTIAAGKRVFSAIGGRASQAAPERNHEFIRQIASYAVIDRQAFMPRLFTMYQIGLTSRVAELGRPVSDPIEFELLSRPFEQWPAAGKAPLGYASNWRRDFDYVLLFDFDSSASLPSGTSLHHKGNYFRILEINP